MASADKQVCQTLSNSNFFELHWDNVSLLPSIYIKEVVQRASDCTIDAGRWPKSCISAEGMFLGDSPEAPRTMVE